MSSIKMSDLVDGAGTTSSLIEKVKERTLKDPKTTFTYAFIFVGIIVNFALYATIMAQNKVMADEIKHLRAIINANNLTPRNCKEYDLEESGFYTVDPMKKPGDSSSFEVFCDKDLETSTIGHDQPDPVQVDNCKDQSCFKLKLNYDTSLENIKALISSSADCYQEVHFTCYLAKITGFAGFTDGNGQFHQYFNDDKNSLCQCHDHKSCFSPNRDVTNTCHCDVGDTFDRSDVIKVANKHELPITEVSYNLMNKETQRATVKVGPLVCQGSRISQIIGDSCLNLKHLGQPSGFYALPSQNKSKPFEIKKCDMTKIEFEARLEFYQDFSPEMDQWVPLTFDKILINDVRRYEFVAPQDGYYVIGGSRKHVEGGCDFHLKVNGQERSFPFFGPDYHFSQNESVSLMAKLTKKWGTRSSDCKLPCSKEDPCFLTFSKTLEFR